MSRLNNLGLFDDTSSIDDDKGYNEITASYTNVKVKSANPETKKIVEEYMDSEYPERECWSDCIIL
jgi:hypothetical protein